jgi:GT2 family glycosyltransferase
MRPPKVSIVILNWNGHADTIACLESITQLETGNFQIETLVVDNASTNDSVEKIKKTFPKINIVKNKENLGFAQGNNEGIKYAMEHEADYVLVLNNDTILDKNLVLEFLRSAEKHPKAGVMTGKIYFAKGYEYHKTRYKKQELGKVVWSAGGDIDWKNVYGTNHGVDEVDTGQFSKERHTDFATGACSFLNVNALKQVGLYDKKYYLYLEDMDLSHRIKLKNWEIIYVPKAILWHKVSQSSGIGSSLNDYYITRNRLLFGMKYASKRTKAALIKESLKFLTTGRKWQKKGVLDYYLQKFGKGSWN